MKSTQVIKRLKEITGSTTNEEALKAIELGLQVVPYGVLILVNPNSPNRFSTTTVGLNQNVSVLQLRAVQASCRKVADNLDATIDALHERNLEASKAKENGNN